MSAERERDRLLEDLLKHELASAAPTDVCLDTETIAAWMDGGLDPQAMAMAEAHASNCARCQAVVATIARTTPAAVAVTESQGTRLWRWWFAPLAAAAAAVTIWMVVPQDRLTAPPAVPALESPSPESSLAKGDTPPPTSPPAAAPPSAANRADARRDRADAPAARAQPGAPKREARAFEARERAAETAKAADPAAAGRLAEVAPTAAPPAPAAAAVTQQAKAFADERITARSAPSPGVIWQVGRAGLIQLAIDGRTFVRVPFPETIDLTAVTATDERRATVTTADGRVFETADGGRIWQRQP